MKKIAVIGIGKLGLCIALQLDKAGYDVLGIDVNDEYMQTINDRSLRSPEPGVEDALRNAKTLRAGNIGLLQAFDPDVILIAVATPSLPSGGYDHSMIDGVLDKLYAMGTADEEKDIVICCTTIPGYCDSKAIEALEYNYRISYKPEFIAQGTIMQNLQCPDQVLIGEADEEAGEIIEKIFSAIHTNTPAVHRMDRTSAEITKLATNCFLTMKIAFANAVGDLCEQSGVQTEKVLAAIGDDSRIGNKFLHYGFGFGGPCFPRDNRALAYFAQKNGFEMPIAKATDEANRLHLDFQFQQYLQLHPNGDPIHFFSVTYKKGTNILEESQQLALAVKLGKAGKRIIIHDTEEVISQVKALYGNLFEYAKTE